MHHDDKVCSVKGPRGNHVIDRHTCIHNTVVLNNFMKELFCGLAEQILVEFNIRMKQCDNTNILENESMHNDIRFLSIAAGKKIGDHTSSSAMLKAFSVGTSTSRKFAGSPSKESICPLQECKYLENC